MFYFRDLWDAGKIHFMLDREYSENDCFFPPLPDALLFGTINKFESFGNLPRGFWRRVEEEASWTWQPARALVTSIIQNASATVFERLIDNKEMARSAGRNGASVIDPVCKPVYRILQQYARFIHVGE